MGIEIEMVVGGGREREREREAVPGCKLRDVDTVRIEVPGRGTGNFWVHGGGAGVLHTTVTVLESTQKDDTAPGHQHTKYMKIEP